MSTSETKARISGRLPPGPNPGAIYYLRYYDGSKQCWQKVGQYDFVKRAKLALERQLSAKAQGFVIPGNQVPGAERTTLREAAASWLAEVKTQRRPNTWSGNRHTLNQFLAGVSVDYLDEIERKHLHWSS